MKAVAWIIFAMVFEISIVVMLAISSFGQGIPMPHTMPAPSNSYFKLTLEWCAATNGNGYKIYRGTNESPYFQTNVVVGLTNTTCTFSNLPDDGSTNCFTATTFDTNGNESVMCAEVHWPRPFLYDVFYIAPATNYQKTNWIACAAPIMTVTNPFVPLELFDTSNRFVRATLSLNPPHWVMFTNQAPTNATGLKAFLTNFYGR